MEYTGKIGNWRPIYQVELFATDLSGVALHLECTGNIWEFAANISGELCAVECTGNIEIVQTKQPRPRCWKRKLLSLFIYLGSSWKCKLWTSWPLVYPGA